MTPDEPDHLSNTLDGSFLSEPLMSDHDESSDATEQEFMTTSSMISPPSQDMDLDSLSARGQAIRTLLADEMSDGYNLTTLAGELGLSPSSASALMTDLKTELELQKGLPQLSPEEYEALKESIRTEGIRVPIIVGRHMLIDGRHRLNIAKELGITDYPVQFVDDKTEQEEHDMGLMINVLRRQLTRDQKQALVRSELQRDWQRSSRQIAAICGVSAPTVEAVRQKMRVEAETVPAAADVDAVKEQVSKLYTPPAREDDVRVTASGQEQHAYAEGRGPAPAAPEADIVLGYVFIEQPGRYAIYRDGAGLRAERV